MTTARMADGTELYFKDWGSGPVITLSHGWPLTADAWDAQMFFFGTRGYRVIAHDRRGHGRSGQSWDGNDMDTYADDLAAMTVSTLLLQGDDDQIVPIDLSSRRSIKILPHGTNKEIAGAPHGLCVTHADAVNADLLAFIES